MKIVIVNGKGTAGKSTFESMVENIAKSKGLTVTIFSTIDYIKECASIMGWDGGKTDNDRRFLSDLKDALTRWNDSPYQKICKKIEANKDKDLIFIDCREPSEISRFVRDYHALTLIVRRGIIKDYGNHADDNVENYDYDIEIENNRGLKELLQEAEIFVETFLESD